MENALIKLIELNNKSKELALKYPKKRFIYNEILNDRGKHYLGIVGHRGIGKSILLKQLLLDIKNSFYISIDTFDGDLYQLVNKLNIDLKISTFLLDEVHFYKDFDREIKKIYDFLEVKIIFTSSSSLSMYSSQYDLSRRVILKNLYPFSFREYLFFKFNKSINKLDFKLFLSKPEICRNYFEYFPYFNEYIQGGLFPYSLDEIDPLNILNNILKTIIYKDIAKISKLSIDELDIIYKIVKYICKSAVDDINYSNLSNNLKITKYKAQQYVSFLVKAFVLNCVFPKGTNVLKEPKILLSPPYRLIINDLEAVIGGLREDFAFAMLKYLNLDLYYLKSTVGKKIPDYIIIFDKKIIVIEVGGKGKGRSQFKGISNYDQKLILSDSTEISDLRRPLFLLGFL